MKMKFFKTSCRILISENSSTGVTAHRFRSFSNSVSSPYSIQLFQDEPFKLEIDIFNSARLSLEKKLNDYVTNADVYRKAHQYTKEKLELTKIINITSYTDIKNLTIGQKELIAGCYSRLAEIYRIGTQDDENTALSYAKLALELAPSLKKPLQIISSITADRAQYPEDFQCEGFNKPDKAIVPSHN